MLQDFWTITGQRKKKPQLWLEVFQHKEKQGSNEEMALCVTAGLMERAITHTETFQYSLICRYGIDPEVPWSNYLQVVVLSAEHEINVA